MKIYKYQNKQEQVKEAVDFIRSALTELKVKKRSLEEDLTRITELLDYIATGNAGTKNVTLQVNKTLGDVTMQVFFDGESMNIHRLIEASVISNLDDTPDEIEIARIREHLRNYYHPKSYNHKYNDGLNTFTLHILQAPYKSMSVLLVALAAGVLFGILLHNHASEQVVSLVIENALNPLSKIFINCIKALSAPLVFFTVSASVSSYSDLSMLGRMGRRIGGVYMINALIAILVAVSITLMFKPGLSDSVAPIENVVRSAAGVAETASDTTVSIRDSIVGIFPANFFRAFVESNLLQVIYLAFLTGIATVLLPGEIRDRICIFLNAGDKLFSKMVSLVMLFMPVSVFCSMASAMISLGAGSLIMIFHWLITVIIALGIMMLIYLCLIRVITKIRPGLYLRKYGEAIMGAFAIGSSNSSLPLCISTAENSLGISKMVASFSLPVGVSLHSASNCVFYTISVFFLANLYSNTLITPLSFPMILVSIFILGIGAPSVTGAGPICVAVLLSQMGFPMGLITLIVGLDPLIGMFKAACSSIEDSYVMLTLAKAENMINMDILHQ